MANNPGWLAIAPDGKRAEIRPLSAGAVADDDGTTVKEHMRDDTKHIAEAAIDNKDAAILAGAKSYTDTEAAKKQDKVTASGILRGNGEGAVTGGALTASDIPDLTLSKITDAGTAAKADAGSAAGNVPVLNSKGELDENVLPAIAITDTFEAATQAAMLALNAEKGDVCVRTDINKSFILKASPASTLANWVELRTPTDAVLNVNGKVGAVTLSASDVGAEPAITAGTTAQYHRGDKTWQDFAVSVRAAVLTGLSTATNAAVAATDSILAAIGKLQAQISARLTAGNIKAGTNVTVSSSGNDVTVNADIPDATASVKGKVLLGASGGAARYGNAADAGAVPASRTVNGKALSADITLTASDLGLATVTQAEAEAGTATTARAWTAQRVRQAIDAVFINSTAAVTLSASGWKGSSPYTQTVAIPGVRAGVNWIYDVAGGATSEQRKQFIDVQIFDATPGGQDTVTFAAEGGRPTVDIPLKILIVG